MTVIPEIRANGTIDGQLWSDGHRTDWEHAGGDVIEVDHHFRRVGGIGFTTLLGRLWADGPRYIYLGPRLYCMRDVYLRVTWRTPGYLLWLLAAYIEKVVLVALIGIGIIEHDPNTMIGWYWRRSAPIYLRCDTRLDMDGRVQERLWFAEYRESARQSASQMYLAHNPITPALRAYWAHLRDCFRYIPRMRVLG